jgi:hypothetical protein
MRWDDLTNNDRLKTEENPLAVVEDGSGFHAALISRYDFGCVLWENGAPAAQ